MILNGSLDFDSLFKEFYKTLCYYGLQFTNDLDETEDIVQDAFLKLYNSYENFTSKQAAKGFLYTCVRNSALNNIRHGKVHKNFLLQQDARLENEDYIFENVVKAEVLGAIYNAIETLPEQCKKIFRMGYVENFKNHEIAGHLGLSVNTIKTQKKKALRLLRLKLSDINPDYYIVFGILIYFSKKF